MLYMKLLVAGSRDFNDYNLLKDTINKLNINPDLVICGMARGADMLGYRYALENNINIEKHKPDWNAYGKRAGMLRNQQMCNRLSEEDIAIIFWDGESKGTKNMIDLLTKNNIKKEIIFYKENLK